MKMSLRKILEDAGRYDDVTKILEDIVKNIHNGMYCCNNKKVNGYDIHKEATALLMSINFHPLEKSLENLYDFVCEEVEGLLNNYAMCVSLKHKIKPSMDELIIPYLIIRSIIHNIIVYGFEFDDFTIPKGWKKTMNETKDVTAFLVNFMNYDSTIEMFISYTISVADSLNAAIKTAQINMSSEITKIESSKGNKLKLYFGENNLVVIQQLSIYTKNDFIEEK